ncbi:MAG TPA: pirin family protein [Cyclobacteriaceae bacterium]|nr:pirin family protein [Cyclobacteriaceae bacterium]
MSNIQLIIEERSVSIGNFMVGRLLPFREKRMVGPFAFIDHMGPVSLKDEKNLDVPPHPHIGLSTLTYLFEGTILHRDSIGTEVEIKPGAVNWMTAGKGIVHSERIPDRLKSTDMTLHGLQIWVALPKNLEEMEPSFAHVDEDQLPLWHQDGVQVRLIAGEVFGRKSAVPVYSPLYFIEIKSQTRQKVNLGSGLFGESGLYILQGNIYSEGHTYDPKHILIAKDATLCEFEMGENTTVFIFGGAPFAENRYIDWNFVASDKSLIERAKKNWREQTFPKIKGETEFVPLPQYPLNTK